MRDRVVFIRFFRIGGFGIIVLNCFIVGWIKVLIFEFSERCKEMGFVKVDSIL